MIHHLLNRKEEGIKEDAPKRHQSNNIISFFNDYLRGIQVIHDDPIVVSIIIKNYDVKKILMDYGSSIEMLFLDTFVQMNLSRDNLLKISILLTRFGGNLVGVEREITLIVIIGIETRYKIFSINFMFVQTFSAYNAILG